MKIKIIISILSMVLILGTFAPVLATNDLRVKGLINQTQRLIRQASQSAVRQENQLRAVIKRSDTLINNRVDWLNKLLARVQKDKRLSANEQTAFVSSIQEEISNLNTLKTKIDADTTLSVAQSDSKQVIIDYRVYAYFVPKQQLLVTVDNLQVLTSDLQNLIPNLQTLIRQFQSEGKDVSALQSLLSDINTQLQDANNLLVSDQNTLNQLSFSSTDYKTTFTKVRSDLQGVRTNFQKVRTDLQQMRQDFKSLIKNKSTSTSSSSGDFTSSTSSTLSK